MNEAEKKQKIELIKSNVKIIERHSEVLKDIVKSHHEVRERAIKYTYQLITAIGVVAGFGFTAISSVKVILLFILGELLLILAMAFGMRFVRKGFIDEAELYTTYIDRISKTISNRNSICTDDSFQKIKTQMESIANSELKIFDDEKLADINSKFFFSAILYLFVGGSILILLSLLVDWGKYLFCI